MTAPRTLAIAGLTTWHVPGPAHAPAVVMLHGYGANRQDLAPLHAMIDVPGGASWYFPDAPHGMDFGYGMLGRAWFPIDMLKLQSLMEKGRMAEMPALLTAGLADARETMLRFLQELGRPLDQVVIAGFSQGALLSLETALSLPGPLRGLGLFSGIHLPTAQWDERFPRLRGTPTFQSHGRQDPVLPFAFAAELHERMTAAGLPARFLPFTGGHEIPPAALQGFSACLAEVP